jgi:hypothetical protein
MFNEAILVVVPEAALVDAPGQSALGAVEIRCPAWDELACRREDLQPARVRADARDGPALPGVSARMVRRAVAARFG